MPRPFDGEDFLPWDDLHIELAGFEHVDPAQRAVMDRIVTAYARRLSSRCEHFEKLRLTMKGVHTGAHPKKVEVHGRLVDNGTSYTSRVTDHDLFVVLDRALKKLENSVAR